MNCNSLLFLILCLYYKIVSCTLLAHSCDDWTRDVNSFASGAVDELPGSGWHLARMKDSPEEGNILAFTARSPLYFGQASGASTIYPAPTLSGCRVSCFIQLLFHNRCFYLFFECGYRDECCTVLLFSIVEFCYKKKKNRCNTTLFHEIIRDFRQLQNYLMSTSFNR
jgi:hypothetical protein